VKIFVILLTHLCILGNFRWSKSIISVANNSQYFTSLGVIGVWANKQPGKIYKKLDAWDNLEGQNKL
jgi:hypothetical protein